MRTVPVHRVPVHRVPFHRVALLVGAALCIAGATTVGCKDDAPSPFVGGGGAGGGDGGEGRVDPDPDPTLGGPCTVDEQCDDGFGCTFDSCDQDIQRCRFLPDDSQCQNELFCDGEEVCDNKLGCILGEPRTCSDGSPCTINTCDEDTDSCVEQPRDVDGDGDPDEHCGGGDCDDFDPLIASTLMEVCNNQLDDDCDDEVDEAACSAPMNDTCLDPLTISGPGTYPLHTQAASLDYTSACGVQNPPLARDVVAALELAAGAPRDIQITARSEASDVAASIHGQCAQAATEMAMLAGVRPPPRSDASRRCGCDRWATPRTRWCSPPTCSPTHRPM